jgi:hypothetical protein
VSTGSLLSRSSSTLNLSPSFVNCTFWLTSVLLSIAYTQGKNIFDLTGKWSDPQLAPLKIHTSSIFLHIITITILGKGYKLWSPILCTFL